MSKTCDNCAHSAYYTVRVGDRMSDTVEDWDCDMLDRMTDEDTEMSNIGRCPYWKEIE